MSWEDLITHVMSTTTKVELMAVYDMRGRPVAITEGLETSVLEGRAVINCLKDNAKMITKLHVGDEDFICVPGINDTFIGTSIRNPLLVIVAQQDSGHVAVVVGQSTGRGSFIFELKQSLVLKSQGKLITQQQLQQQQEQQQRLLPMDGDMVDVDGGADKKSDGDFLVDVEQ